MYLRSNWQTTKGKKYKYYKIIESKWNPDIKQSRQTVVHYLGNLSEQQAYKIKLILKIVNDKDDEIIVARLNDILYEDYYSYLEIAVIFHFWNYWDFENFFKSLPNNNSRNISQDLIIKILVANRSLLSLANQNIPDWISKTVIPFLEKNDLKKINETRIHRALDWIFSNRDKLRNYIRESVIKKYPDKIYEIYCDLSYIVFEGKKIGDFNRYNKAVGSHILKKKIIIWLVVTEEGYPLDWDVLRGNVTGIETLKEHVENINKMFSNTNTTLIFDRGMVSEEVLELPFFKERKYISGLKQNQIKTRIGKKIYELKKMSDDLSKNKKFKIESILNFQRYKKEEIYLSDICEKENKRYILGFNKLKWLEDRTNRNERIKQFEEKIEAINLRLKNAQKTKDKNVLIREVFDYAQKKRVKSFYNIKFESIKVQNEKVQSYQVILNKKDSYLEEKKLFDGLFLLVTNQNETKPKENQKEYEYIISKEKILSSYRSKDYVEKAFQNLNSYINIEPVRHKLKNKIISHVDICMMSYLINITIYNILKSNESLKFGCIKTIYNELKKCNLGKINIKNIPDEKQKINLNKVTKLQKEILKQLKCSHLVKPEYIKKLKLQ